MNNTLPKTSYRTILMNPTLTPLEKLVYIIIDQEQPCDFKVMATYTYQSEEQLKMIVKKLMDCGLIVKSTSGANLYYTSFTLLPIPQKKKPTKERVTITERDKNIALFVKKIEEYYKQRGVSYRISRNGRKQIANAVSYLNKVWKKSKGMKEFDGFRDKGELYSNYIEFTFDKIEDDKLQALKRLTFSATKNTWRKYLKNDFVRFKPYLLEDKTTDKTFIGVKRGDIPDLPQSEGYWTTVNTFLIPKWKTKTYPVCKQVLYALERVIVYHLYRKHTSAYLIKMHEEYVKEYKAAETRGRLDDLIEYVKENKKRSNFCHGCTKTVECHVKNPQIIVSCNEKTT